jgi:hypothetical protein
MTTEKVTVVRSQLERLDTLCAGVVTRDGDEDACCKDATTIVHDAESADVWPACTWHAHRYGGALTLAQIRDALTAGSTRIEREVADQW